MSGNDTSKSSFPDFCFNRSMRLIDSTTLESNKKIIVYRVLQELLVNMKKHSRCSLVVITFKKNKNKLQIDYSDNGVGASLDKKNSRNGLQNVENRILSIKGNITFDTNTGKGFKTSLSIPA
jgi:signal transduction histidine kinase